MIARVLVLAVALVTIASMQPSSSQAFDPGDSIWRFLPPQYCINTAGIPKGADEVPIMSPEDFIALVQWAFQRWEDIPESKISFVYDGECKNTRRRDAVNAVGWVNMGKETCTIQGRYRVCGHALGAAYSDQSKGKYLRGGAAYEIVEADAFMNSYLDPKWNIEEYVTKKLPHILLHEVGHFIGLDHSDEESCTIMAPTLEKLLPDLCQDDIDGAKLLYPPDGRP